eukprot:1105060-Prorocentrum_minimum.AAC.1
MLLWGELTRRFPRWWRRRGRLGPAGVGRTYFWPRGGSPLGAKTTSRRVVASARRRATTNRTAAGR